MNDALAVADDYVNATTGFVIRIDAAQPSALASASVVTRCVVLQLERGRCSDTKVT